eukprot:jgi/Bigna1/66764/fgenesh1_pg.2_\
MRLDSGAQIKKRRQGVAYPLKKFHNLVKRLMLAEVSNIYRRDEEKESKRKKQKKQGDCNHNGGKLSLLDVGCGRACDLAKWRDAGLDYVFGIDKSKDIIREAVRRSEEARTPHQVGWHQGRRRWEIRGKAGLTGAMSFEKSTGGCHPLQTAFAQYPHFGTEKFDRAKIEQLLLRQSSGGSKLLPSFMTTQGVGGGREEEGLFSLASSMFAFQFFFESNTTATTALRNIAQNLRPGGYAIFVFPDGKRVEELFKTASAAENDNTEDDGSSSYRHKTLLKGATTVVIPEQIKSNITRRRNSSNSSDDARNARGRGIDGVDVFANDFMRVRRRWKGVPAPEFGAGYIFELKDTVTEGIIPCERGNSSSSSSSSTGATEYLIDRDSLIARAKCVGLHLVRDWGANNSPVADLFEVGDATKGVRHLKPPYLESHPSLAAATRLYAVAVFMKNR